MMPERSIGIIASCATRKSLRVSISPRKQKRKMEKFNKSNCKHYFRGKCNLAYQIHGYGLNFNSRKHAWMWKCPIGKAVVGCDSYQPKEKKSC